MKTLKESGYTGWPYIHNSKDVCFVWYSRSLKTGKVCKDLAWTSFDWTRSTRKLVSHEGSLVSARVPSRHFNKSIEELAQEASQNPALYPLPSYKEWVGPFLYMTPLSKPTIGGQVGQNFLLLAKEPARSAGLCLGYGSNANFEPVLQVQA